MCCVDMLIMLFLHKFGELLNTGMQHITHSKHGRLGWTSNGTGIFSSESAASFARDFDPSGCRTHLKDCEMICASRFDSSVMSRRSALLFAGKMTFLRYVAICVSRSLTICCFTSL